MNGVRGGGSSPERPLAQLLAYGVAYGRTPMHAEPLPRVDTRPLYTASEGLDKEEVRRLADPTRLVLNSAQSTGSDRQRRWLSPRDMATFPQVRGQVRDTTRTDQQAPTHSGSDAGQVVRFPREDGNNRGQDTGSTSPQ